MSALFDGVNKTSGQKSSQVFTGGACANSSNPSQFTNGQGATSQQCIEHECPALVSQQCTNSRKVYIPHLREPTWGTVRSPPKYWAISLGQWKT
jgi:hypothetical protein